MDFKPDTLDKELKRITKVSVDDKSKLAELLRDWSYSVAFAVAHEKKKGEVGDPVITKFGSEENFKKYLHTLAKKLIEAGYKINIKNPKIKKYFEDFKLDTKKLSSNYLYEKIQELPDAMIVNKGFIKIVGSSLNSDKPNDLDVYINANSDEITDWLYKRIQIMFEKAFGLPVDIVFNRWNGPLEDYIDIYDLVLVKRPEYKKVYFSEKKPDIEIIKPYKTFWNTITEDEIPFDDWVMQPKYNGMKVIVLPDGTTYSEGFERLPLDLSFIFKTKPPKNMVFIGEVWSKYEPRQIVIGNARKGIFDNKMTVTIYDAVDTKHKDETYEERYEYIKSYVKKQYVVPNYYDLPKMKDIMKHPYFDGVIIKDLDAPFISKRQMIKVKKEVDFDAQVLKRKKTKAGTYIYHVGFINDGEIQDAGKTMATKEKFEVGDIIEIAPLEVTYYEDQDKLKIYVARVKGLSTHKKPDTVEDVIKIAEKNGILNVIEGE